MTSWRRCRFLARPRVPVMREGVIARIIPVALERPRRLNQPCLRAALRAELLDTCSASAENVTSPEGGMTS